MLKREKLVTVSEELRELKLTHNEISDILNERDRIILFHQEVAENLGQNVAQLLSQVEYLWKSWGRKPFYKYMNACPSARKGDSMVEKLSISYSTLHRLLKKVGTPVRNKKKAAHLAKTGEDISTLIVYSKKYDGNTYWYFNENLYNKLRAMFKASYQDGRKAILPTCEDGLPSKLKGSISIDNTKNIKNKKKEKMYKKEKDQKPIKTYFNNSEDKSQKKIDREEKKRNEVKAKANSPTFRPAQSLVDDKRKGQPMPLDFSVSPSIMAKALEEYGDESWLLNEEDKFINHFTNKNPKAKVVDWSAHFLNSWLKNAHDWRKRDEERQRESGTTESASAERLRRLQELTTRDIFGDATLEELTENLYKKRYGSHEDGSNA